MRRELISLLFGFSALSAMASEPLTNLIVWAKDGTKVAYALVEKPKISFTTTDLIVTSNDVKVSYALENLERFTYEKNTVTGITDLGTDKTVFKFDGEALLFPSLKAFSTVSIYSTNGEQILEKTVTQDGEYSFSISNLHTGVYMVKVNGLTYKIVKK